MTDLEISKALALAIGHINPRILYVDRNKQECVVFYEGFDLTFSYRDWNVIGPIAEKFDCFPEHYVEGWYAYVGSAMAVIADTPQKAIALAVIGAKK